MKRWLTNAEKDEILKEHIPYKLTQLRHHHHYKELYRTKILADNPKLYRLHEICALEIAFVAGRLFLEFLGLSFSQSSARIIQRTNFYDDDLLITDFNCDFVKKGDLNESEIDVLSEFYNRANKGSGHFTWQTRERDGYQSVDDGTIIIERLLKNNLYDKLGLELKEKSD